MSFLKQRKWLISIVIVILIVLFFIGRSIAFQYVLAKVQEKLASRNLQLNYEKAELNGLKSASFESLSIKDSLKDTIFYSEKITLSLKLSRLIMGKVGLSEFQMQKSFARVDLQFFRSRGKITASDSALLLNQGFDDRLRKAFDMFFDYIPTTLQIEDFTFFYKKNHGFSIKVPNLSIKNKTIEGYVVSADTTGSSMCNINGNYDPSNTRFNFVLSGEKGNAYKLPFFKKFSTIAKFDSLWVKFDILSDESDQIRFEGSLQLNKLVINNKKISPSDVTTDFGYLSFQLIAGNDYIELDSISQAAINKLAFNVYARYEKNSHRFLSFKIPAFEFEASQLFESFPSGLFTSIRDMKVHGGLAYSLDFHIDLDMPDSVRFSSSMDKKGFKIDKFGAANLYLMNNTFSHWVYNPNGTSRILKVSPSYAGFVALSEVSPYLQYAVLTSEDGGFFHHKGFNEEAIAMSISTNIKEGRFKRGASTISMQLIKNLYLTRNKTMSRKLEEIFITWMIENMRTVSKERMFEVYLNIIEWGPNIFGIKEAARFYFDKKPSELNLRESIFLASIVPSPRNFKYSFDESGHLKEFLSSYYKNVSGIMLRRGQITASDTVNLKPEISLAPSAMKFVHVDTLETEEKDYFDLLELF